MESEKCKNLLNIDKEIYEMIIKEEKRQRDHIELIASENFVSQSVLEAMGSVLTNKYAEGYPKKRYYGGCEYIDEVFKDGYNALVFNGGGWELKDFSRYLYVEKLQI